ncbi:MAG: AAA family ATPase [Anaerolineae bacterium]|nr:AAA family ATPase [Anaerolineae bacterium]
MAVTLFRTKLYIPRAREGLVSRARLLERLQAALNHRLTLISAPAGFGKTTLLSECAAQWKSHISWLSLDEHDNNAPQFWAYVIAALQTLDESIGSGALEAIEVPHIDPDAKLLGELTNDLAAHSGPIVLVLDDLHVITNPQIHEQLTFFVERLPPQTHLVVCSRADPPWPLARWRARGQIVELRTHDLRFTPAEAFTFLNETMALGLPAEDAAALGARTEGWIAGLQLAALALQAGAPLHGQEASSFVSAFSGSHRFVLDYLVEEVLDRQPADIHEFLLHTSILERLTAPLCDAVRFGASQLPQSSMETGRGSGDTVQASGDSQAILERLEHANLFLVPLDGERRWYRYHHLFADLLRSRLAQEHGARVPVLHRRASAWCEAQGLVSEAVRHALAAGDGARVARMARQRVMAMMDHGALRTMAGWLDALPEEMVRSEPWLSIAQAWPLAYAGQGHAVEPLLQDAEQAVAGPGAYDEEERRSIVGHLAAIRAYVVAGRGELASAAALAREALAWLPWENRMARGWAAYQLGFVLRMKGELQLAAQALDEAASISQAAGDSHVAILALGELGVLRAQQGRLHGAAATYRQALARAEDYARHSGRRLPATGYVLTRLSGVLLEWNDLEAAVHHAREGLALCKQWQQADALLEANLHLARALQAAGDVAGARQAVHAAMDVARDTSPWFVAYAQAQTIRMKLAGWRTGDGSRQSIEKWARTSALSAGDEPSFQHELAYRMLARSLIEGGQVDQGLALLGRLLSVVELAGAGGHALEILVLQAMALQAQTKNKEALAALARALDLGEPEGYVRVFLDEGAPMGHLLRRAVVDRVAADYARRLLDALEGELAPAALQAALPPLVEPLSPRETEVLRLLTTHLSHAEMADVLVLSVNTVRSHIKHIYDKLDAHSRMEAVARATELGLLD